jgi:ArsR family transcriptional regulator
MCIDTLAERFDECQYVWQTGRVTTVDRSPTDADTDTGPDAPAAEPRNAGPVLCCGPLTGAVLDEAEATELAGVLKALADPIRLRLLSIVAAQGEICACDLPALLDRSQPTISHHLSQLTKAGVLEREQRGKWAWFRLRADRLAQVSRALGEPITP